MDEMRFRQVHLDFHTSGLIDGIGSRFDKKAFQEALKEGHVDSITLFSKCHHGYSYHPSKVNEMHPGLTYDLLAAQLQACKEIGVRTPVYVSAGFDEKDAVAHPEWLLMNSPDAAHDFLERARWHIMCYNSSYLDKLVAEVEEVMQRYAPEEIFLDISAPRPCYCNNCMRSMMERGMDPKDPANAKAWAEEVYKNYAVRIEQAVRKYSPDTQIFHNNGNIPMGRRDIAGYDTHFELESLPTGGWGYDHFPMSASYCRNLGKEYLGMTGKFHGHWGEFGGFKHPNALIYETSLSLAFGAKCSIGDQLHPSGEMNAATYRLIGKAYSQVEEKEAWCRDVKAVVDIAVLSAASAGAKTGWLSCDSDVGANRMLLEGKYLYDFIDTQSDLSKYKLVILPDLVPTEGALLEKLEAYLEAGGKVLASGISALPGITVTAKSKYNPTFMKPTDIAGFVNGETEYIMYTDHYLFEADDSYKTVAIAADPYFNREPMQFCSHHHAPNRAGSEHPGAVISNNVGYIGWNIFEDYGSIGSLHLKELVYGMIEKLLGAEKTLVVRGLPDRGVATLNVQEEKNRMVAHVLFAHTCIRGKNTEVIEDCVPLSDIELQIQLKQEPKSVKLVPQGVPLESRYEEGVLTVRVPEVYIHQMIEISFICCNV